MPSLFAGLHHRVARRALRTCLPSISRLIMRRVSLIASRCCRDRPGNTCVRCDIQIRRDKCLNARAAPASPPHRPARKWCVLECCLLTLTSRSKSSVRPLPCSMRWTMRYKPAGAFAARRALAAGFFKIKIRQALQRFHHASGFVHHDHRAGAEHRTCFGNGIVIHVGGHHDIRRAKPACDDPPGITALNFLPPRMPPAISSNFANGVPSRHFIVAGPLHMAGNGK